MLGIGKGKALVEHHGNLVVVDASTLYETEQECYRGAWLDAMDRAGKLMAKASEYRARSEKLAKD